MASAHCKLKVEISKRSLESQASGNGPVNAIDQALRMVLTKQFSGTFTPTLTGYRVREVDSESATAARVAVYIDFTDKHETWTTVASSTNVVQASVNALTDGYVYCLRKRCDRDLSSRRRSAIGQ
jgi:2-isopropylmalate synthase